MHVVELSAKNPRALGAFIGFGWGMILVHALVAFLTTMQHSEHRPGYFDEMGADYAFFTSAPWLYGVPVAGTAALVWLYRSPAARTVWCAVVAVVLMLAATSTWYITQYS